ncbi:hypothetical protein K431DRAFT_284132 [Polychaeton citri CBS 116435]|uniref:Uncharacterized protein n=1 Tax=Polychaeton citri CBS 116435 TaxID=1314669 RepID=A0A9P4UQV5_9PEZI|nr:hypothetical protein K431DRAFT_284132 [Polychaeton citri CBS 116435]
MANYLTTRLSVLSNNLTDVNLSLAGILLLADLDTVARRTATSGSSCLTDALVLAPGLHRQQDATELHKGEYPACAAMTSGYVFRVETPATVLYMQRVGRTGQLTTLRVHGAAGAARRRWASSFLSVPYLVAVSLTPIAVSVLLSMLDWWALAFLGILVTSRLLNVLVIQSRADVHWKGATEPGVDGDLLILLSQDRWVRLRGAVDDLKVVAPGQWLKDRTFWHSSVTSIATLLVYFDVALFVNASQAGKVLILLLLVSSTGLLAVANESTDRLEVHGRIIEMDGQRRAYRRRLDMAKELIEETCRDDWALGLGMVKPDKETQRPGPPIM